MVATIKVRNFHAVKDVLENFGVAPAYALKRAGLDPNLFSNKENVVLYADVARLVAECARLAHCDDFRLRVGMREDVSVLGLTGLLSLSAMKVGEALQFIVAGLKTSDTGGFRAPQRHGFPQLYCRRSGRSQPGASGRRRNGDRLQYDATILRR
jgi:hypothetical protein